MGNTGIKMYERGESCCFQNFRGCGFGERALFGKL